MNSGSLRCKAASQKRLLIWHKVSQKQEGKRNQKWEGTKRSKVMDFGYAFNQDEKNIAIIITFTIEEKKIKLEIRSYI